MPDAPLSLPNWLDSAVHAHPGKLALQFASTRWTFAELRDAADEAGRVLLAVQSAAGGRIGILSTNRPGFVFAVHAATTLALPIVPLNVRQTSDEIAWQLRDAEITTLVVDEQRSDIGRNASAGQEVGIVPITSLEQPPSRSGQPADGSKAQYEELGFRGPIRLDREAVVLYTSGTSGRPKGARITYGNLWFSAVASSLHLGHHLNDAWLAMLPLYHIGGLAILFRGAITATPALLHERFEPESALIAIEAGATLVSVVPAMLQRMLDHHGEMPWPSTLRCILVGGSATPPELLERCLRLGVPVAPTYGLTETTSQVTTLLPDEARAKPSSSGVPLPVSEVRIAGTSCARAGEIGDIEVRGPTVFSGYLDQDEGRSPLTTDGWFRTGDAGFLDEDGYLTVVDRRSDLIMSGGENIYPAEIERVLRDHPRVSDAGVIGQEDTTWGARPVAAVVWSGDPTEAPAELRRLCADRLAAFKIPDRIVLVSALPRSPSGKLLRRVLRESLLESTEASSP